MLLNNIQEHAIAFSITYLFLLCLYLNIFNGDNFLSKLKFPQTFIQSSIHPSIHLPHYGFIILFPCLEFYSQCLYPAKCSSLLCSDSKILLTLPPSVTDNSFYIICVLHFTIPTCMYSCQIYFRCQIDLTKLIVPFLIILQSIMFAPTKLYYIFI